MLRHTFIHAPGIGCSTERALWEQGITDWAEFHARSDVSCVGPALRASIRASLQAGEEALKAGDAGHFERLLPARESWRLYGDFHASTRYLDIETTGLSWRHDPITVIGVSDGRSARAFVAGRDLDSFEEALRGAALLVTFNGKGFDVPFIRHRFPRAKLPAAHIDLRHLFRSLGLTGGLKRIERECGLDRGDLAGVDGACAVALWHRHLAGDPRALPALVRYNLEDVVNLPYLAAWAYNRSLKHRRAPGAPLPLTPVEPPPLDYSREILREIAADLASMRPFTRSV